MGQTKLVSKTWDTPVFSDLTTRCRHFNWRILQHTEIKGLCAILSRWDTVVLCSSGAWCSSHLPTCHSSKAYFYAKCPSFFTVVGEGNRQCVKQYSAGCFCAWPNAPYWKLVDSSSPPFFRWRHWAIRKRVGATRRKKDDMKFPI